jgi:prepilin-type N-terminal cleavage/methylation domain-containing protein
MHNFSPRDRSSSPRSAFSLTELLVVIGIIAMITVISVPAYNAFNQSHTLTRGASDLSLLLEYARTEAVARQTYVWVGVEEIKINDRPALAFGAAYSKDGTGTNTDPTKLNLAPLNRSFQVPGVVAVEWNALSAETRGKYVGPAPQNVAGNREANLVGVQFQVGSQTFDGKTITFTPRGEALLKGNVAPDDGYSEAIAFSLRQTRGKAVTADSDDLAVVVTGSTGTVRLIRVH